MDIEVYQPRGLFPEAVVCPDQVAAIVVHNQASYERLANLILDLQTLEKKIIARHEEPKKTALAAHRASVKSERIDLDPVQAAIALGREKAKDYERNQARLLQLEQQRIDRERRAAEEADRKRREEEARVARAAALAEQERLRKLDEELRLQRAAELEATGASKATVEVALETPVFAPEAVPDVQAFMPAPALVMAPTIAAPTFERVKGLGVRKPTYKARVTNARLLARAVADGSVPESYISANDSVLNARAKADGMNMRVPGVEVYEV